MSMGANPDRSQCVKIEIYPDEDVVAAKAAAIIATEMCAAVSSRGRFIMAVSGGRTPWLMLRSLAEKQFPWEHVHVFQVNERVAPAADPDRNLSHLRKSLLDHAPLPADHMHAMLVEAADLERAAEQYAQTMRDRHAFVRIEPWYSPISRQALPTFDRTKYASANGVARGAYVMADAPHGPPEVILLASGSELSLAVVAYETLSAEGIRSRLVSMQSWDLFEHQPQSYRESVLPSKVTVRIAVEQGSVLEWDRYVGAAGKVVGMKTFGASAPLRELQRKFGFEPELIVTAARQLLGRA
jgi:hypothetical protein